MEPVPENRGHQRHLEQARDQIAELLQRQAVERQLVNRGESPRQDVVAALVRPLDPDDIANLIAPLGKSSGLKSSSA